MTTIYNFFGGRTTFFLFWFFVVSVVLALMDKLTGQWIAVAGALQTIATLRAAVEDWKDTKRQGG